MDLGVGRRAASMGRRFLFRCDERRPLRGALSRGLRACSSICWSGRIGVRACAFGVLAGLAYWTRPEGLVLVVVAVVCMAWRAWTTRSSAVVCFAARRLPSSCARRWPVVSLRRGADRGGLRAHAEEVDRAARPGRTLGRGARPRSPRAARGARGSARRFRFPRARFARTARASNGPSARSRASSRRSLGSCGLRSPPSVTSCFVFACLGLVAAARRVPRERRAFESVLAVSLLVQTGVLVLLVWGAGYVSRRHALAAWLPARGLRRARVDRARSEGEGVSRSTGSGWRIRRGSRAATPGARGGLSVLVVFLVLSWGPRDLRERRADRALERVAAEWLKESQAAVGPVAAQKRRTAYYAGAPFVPIPDGRDGQIERQIRGRGTRWLVIDAAKLGDHRGLAEGIGRWLDPVHSERAAGQEILVLEVIAGSGALSLSLATLRPRFESGGRARACCTATAMSFEACSGSSTSRWWRSPGSAAYAIRFHAGIPAPLGTPPLSGYLLPLPLILPLFLVLFHAQGLYQARRMDSPLGEAGAVIRATAARDPRDGRGDLLRAGPLVLAPRDRALQSARTGGRDRIPLLDAIRAAAGASAGLQPALCPGRRIGTPRRERRRADRRGGPRRGFGSSASWPTVRSVERSRARA